MLQLFQQNPILEIALRETLSLKLFCYSSALGHCRTSHPAYDSGQTSSCHFNSDLCLALRALVMSLLKAPFCIVSSMQLKTLIQVPVTSQLEHCSCSVPCKCRPMELVGPAEGKGQSPSLHTSVF